MKGMAWTKIRRRPMKIVLIMAIYSLVIMLSMSAGLGVCYAYFSAKVDATGSVNTGTLTIEYHKTSVDMDTDNLEIADKDNNVLTSTSCVMPGDTLKIKGMVVNTGNVPCYALLKLTFIHIVNNEDVILDTKWYNLDGNSVEFDDDLDYYTTEANYLSESGEMGCSFALTNVNYTVSELLSNDMAGADLKIEVSIETVQADCLGDEILGTTDSMKATNKIMEDANASEE